METIRFEHKDCLELLRELPDGCIDLMLTDLPYGTTSCEWDKFPNLAVMWLEWERVVKPDGAFVFTCSQPVSSQLVTSRAGFFKYELIWHKTSCGSFQLAKMMPLKYHENILVFYRQQPTYNPQKLPASAASLNRYKYNFNKIPTRGLKHMASGNYEPDLDRDLSMKFPESVIRIDSERNAVHPTQKPVDLMRYLIRTYSNEGDTVFDGYAGSGTTAVACIAEKRKFIGCELNAEYYSKAAARIKEERSKLVLF